jgi:hypothetical protein
MNGGNTTAWLALECRDRSGVLADVAHTIAVFGGNIDVRNPCEQTLPLHLAALSV